MLTVTSVNCSDKCKLLSECLCKHADQSVLIACVRRSFFLSRESHV